MTGFWIFMLLMTLLIPLTMLGFGIVFRRWAPREINGVFGYRTRRSMKNRETWAFAHACCGRWWRRAGALMLPLTLGAMLFCLGRGVSFIGIYSMAVLAVQTAVMIGSIFPVEAALRRTFDENGRRRF
ncbi:SdpI family protein [Lawsonibacter celer]|jgi:uncharacterized membrane protein|uniref:SdpI family protein n=1 Tax=Lawsonibacter celer TaxID=2986526 RepID=UPI001645600A|nr:SdpI family protein [Lawsonibacter celer]